MRLWHIDLIPYLPKNQLVAQWRELNSIFKKEDKHILINYLYNYSKEYLYDYSMAVVDEMSKRGIAIKSWLNFNNYFQMVDDDSVMYAEFRFKEHDNEYLTICYWNLREKYLRGQKDFTKEVWDRLDRFYKQHLKLLDKDKKDTI